jgi:dTDP-4-amino-4,6-dideoxygalactose transaminase
VAERVRALRHLGQVRKGEHSLAGWNERLDGLQAALLRAKLPHLDAWNEARRAHAARYRELLPASLRVLEERPESPCVYHLFPVRAGDRDGLAATLEEAGIGTGIHYSPACHRQPPFTRGENPDPFPIASAWAAEELSLPMFEHLAEDEIAHVAEAVARHLVSAARETGVTQT